jgi:hypothetical protein
MYDVCMLLSHTSTKLVMISEQAKSTHLTKPSQEFYENLGIGITTGWHGGKNAKGLEPVGAHWASHPQNLKH